MNAQIQVGIAILAVCTLAVSILGVLITVQDHKSKKKWGK